MKRILALLTIIPLLTGCSRADNTLDMAMEFRRMIASSPEATFHTEVTADYGDKSYTFGMDCNINKDSSVQFSVTSPESIQGISGSITDTSGKLTFDDKVLLFEPIADGILSPISAPWFFIQGLQSGYIDACAASDNGYTIEIQDNYREKTIHISVCMNEKNVPVYAEIIWDGMRIMSIDIENFTFL